MVNINTIGRSVYNIRTSIGQGAGNFGKTVFDNTVGKADKIKKQCYSQSPGKKIAKKIPKDLRQMTGNQSIKDLPKAIADFNRMDILGDTRKGVKELLTDLRLALNIHLTAGENKLKQEQAQNVAKQLIKGYFSNPKNKLKIRLDTASGKVGFYDSSKNEIPLEAMAQEILGEKSSHIFKYKLARVIKYPANAVFVTVGYASAGVLGVASAPGAGVYILGKSLIGSAIWAVRGGAENPESDVNDLAETLNTGRTQNSPLASDALTQQERETLDDVKRSVSILYTNGKLSVGGLAKFMQASEDNTIARRMINAHNSTKTDPIVGVEI